MSDPPQHYLAYSQAAQATNDPEHLRLLALFHYIYGGLTAVLSSFAIFHIVIGLVMVRDPTAFPMPPTGPGMPFNPGYMFLIMGSIVVASGWTLGTLTILSGRCISFRRARVFSLVIAGINCAFFPFGTLLGVFTFIVLLRPSVAALYAWQRSLATAAPPA